MILIDTGEGIEQIEATHWFVSKDDLICIYTGERTDGIDHWSHVSNVKLITKIRPVDVLDLTEYDGSILDLDGDYEDIVDEASEELVTDGGQDSCENPECDNPADKFDKEPHRCFEGVCSPFCAMMADRRESGPGESRADKIEIESWSTGWPR